MAKKSLLDAYRFEGFGPVSEVKGLFGDPGAMVMILKRRSKKVPALCVARSAELTIARSDVHGIYLVETGEFILSLKSVVFPAGGAE